MRESRLSKNGPNVVLIQDVHLNDEAQVNILRQVGEWENQISVLAVEGAFGAFDFAPYYKAGNAAVRAQLAQSFLGSQRIAAASALGLTHPKLADRMVGVDDERSYAANVQAYLSTQKERAAVLEQISDVERELGSRKQREFSAELKKLDAAVSAYRAGTLSIGRLIELLPSQTAEMAQFAIAYALEKKIDFARADLERRSVLETLSSRLASPDAEELLKSAARFRAGEVSQAAYYRQIQNVFRRSGVSLVNAPHFAAYIQYVLLSDQIRGDVLLNDVESSIPVSLHSLARTPAEHALIDASALAGLQGKLARFELTPQEWHSYRSYQTQNIPSALSLLAFERFYEMADARSEKMVSRLSQRIAGARNPSNVAVLIAGGFHVPDIKARLVARGIGYMVVSPKLTKFDTASGSSYLSYFSREKTPLEKLFAGERLTLTPADQLLGTTNGYTAAVNRDGLIVETLLTQIQQEQRNKDGVYEWSEAGQRFFAIKKGDAIPSGYSAMDAAEISVGSDTYQLLARATTLLEQLFRMAMFPRNCSMLLAIAATVLTRNPLWAILGLPFVLGIAGSTDAFSPLESENSSWVDQNAPLIAGKKIVEVTMEIALSEEALQALKRTELTDEQMRAAAMATSAGGIGPLLKERIIAQAELGADVTGISLLYDTVWVQKRVPSHDGVAADTVHMEKVEVGASLRRVLENAGTVDVEMADGSQITAQVWKAPTGMFGKGTVYFLDYPQITGVMYPGAKDAPGTNEAMRLAQSWLLGRGTLALLVRDNKKPDVLVMSEMPTVFSLPQLILDPFAHHPLFQKVITIFNDHTPLEYAHPKWDVGNLQRMHIDPRYYRNLTVFDSQGSVDGTALIMNAVDGVFGVAAKHGRVIREMPLLSQLGEKIKSVTNGVSAKYWPSGVLRDLAGVAKLSDAELLKIKDEKRAETIRWLAKRTGLGTEWADKIIANNNPLGIWTRRIVQYKRLDLFADIVEDPAKRQAFLDTGIVFVMGGRIHQDNGWGTDQFNRILAAVALDPRLRERVIIFEDYNIWEAQKLFQGADFSVMLADDKQEASATGFQKMQMNGGAIIASNDGAIPESVDETNGFIVPYVDGRPTSEGLLDGFISFRRTFDESDARAKMVRAALGAGPFVSVDRTAKDMLMFLNGVVDQAHRKAVVFEEGRQTSRLYLQDMKTTQMRRSVIKEILAKTPVFSWRYQAYGADERELVASKPGLAGFIESYSHVASLGTAGEWSLGYHAHNNHGYGDTLRYLVDVFRPIPELKPVADVLDSLAAKSLKSQPAEKIMITRMAMGIAQGVQDWLEPVTRQPLPLGLMGFWRHFTSNNGQAPQAGFFVRASFFEGVLIAGFQLKILSWLAANNMLAMPAVSNSALMSSLMIVGWSFVLVFSFLPGLFAMHLSLGVLQPDGRPFWNRWLAMRATWTASSSFLGTPFIVAGFFSHVHPGLAQIFGPYGYILLGVVVAGLAHALLNRWLLQEKEELFLSDTQRANLIQLLQPILDFLAYRGQIHVDEHIQALRQADDYANLSKIDLPPSMTKEELLGLSPDAFLIFGSHYTEVARKAASLYHQFGKKQPQLILFAGGKGPRNPQGWPSEALFFRDIFSLHLHELRLQAQETKLLSETLSASWGRVRRIFVRIRMALKDAIFFWETERMLKKMILIEDSSSNTGLNVKNTARLLRENFIEPHLANIKEDKPGITDQELAELENHLMRTMLPQNPVVITADVFQLRAVLTFLRQYPELFMSVISAPAFQSNLAQRIQSGTLKNDELVELAREAVGIIERITYSYITSTPKDHTEGMYILPVNVPLTVLAANEQLTLKLEDLPDVHASNRLANMKVLNLMKRRIYGVGVVSFFVLGLLALGATFYSAGMSFEYLSALWMTSIAFFALLVPLVLMVLIFSPLPLSFEQGVKTVTQQEVWAKTILVLIAAVLFGNRLVPFAATWEFGVPVTFINIFLMLIMYGWSTEYDVHKTYTDENAGSSDSHPAALVPGAMGFWRALGVSTPWGGAVEGAFVGAISAGAMKILLPLLTATSLPVTFVVLSSLAAGLGYLMLSTGHRLFGVALPGLSRASYNPSDRRAADKTALLSLLGIPLLAASFIAPAEWRTLLQWGSAALFVVPHTIRNVRSENVHRSAFALAIANVDRLQTLDLEHFARERVQIRPLESLVKKTDHLLLAPKSSTWPELEAEIAAALHSAHGDAPVELTVLLSEALRQTQPESWNDATSNIRFVTESEASDAAFIERELAQPAKQSGGKLKFLLYPSARPSDSVLNALLNVARSTDKDNLVEFVLLNVLAAESLAILAGWMDIQSWLEIERVASTHA